MSETFGPRECTKRFRKKKHRTPIRKNFSYGPIPMDILSLLTDLDHPPDLRRSYRVCGRSTAWWSGNAGKIPHRRSRKWSGDSACGIPECWSSSSDDESKSGCGTSARMRSMNRSIFVDFSASLVRTMNGGWFRAKQAITSDGDFMTIEVNYGFSSKSRSFFRFKALNGRIWGFKIITDLAKSIFKVGDLSH